jgi:citrate synthase
MTSTESELPPISATIDDEIFVRGRNLGRDLIGSMTFTEMFLLDLDGTAPSPSRVRMVDAVLVAMMEHGVTPSTLAARLILDGAPDSIQGAIAGGLLAAGPRFLGTIEQSAALCVAIVSDVPDHGIESAAEKNIRAILNAGGRVPGLGHNLHARVDPRVETLRGIAEREGVTGDHVAALLQARDATMRLRSGTHVLNAAGVIGAVLADLGYLPRQARGFAVVARCAGVFAHIADEQRHPIARSVWGDLHKMTSEATRDGLK